MSGARYVDSTVAAFIRSCEAVLRPMIEATPETEFVAAVIYMDQHNGMSIMVSEPDDLTPEQHDAQVRGILSAALEASMFDQPSATDFASLDDDQEGGE